MIFLLFLNYWFSILIFWTRPFQFYKAMELKHYKATWNCVSTTKHDPVFLYFCVIQTAKPISQRGISIFHDGEYILNLHRFGAQKHRVMIKELPFVGKVFKKKWRVHRTCDFHFLIGWPKRKLQRNSKTLGITNTFSQTK